MQIHILITLTIELQLKIHLSIISNTFSYISIASWGLIAKWEKYMMHNNGIVHNFQRKTKRKAKKCTKSRSNSSLNDSIAMRGSTFICKITTKIIITNKS